MDHFSPKGELDNDKMVRVLLTQRNTPDQECHRINSFWQPITRQLPIHGERHHGIQNSRSNKKWRNAWELKEEALRIRIVKTKENLSEHSRTLPPLWHDDQVLIQNQTGRFPRKWDRSGITKITWHIFWLYLCCNKLIYTTNLFTFFFTSGPTGASLFLKF